MMNDVKSTSTLKILILTATLILLSSCAGMNFPGSSSSDTSASGSSDTLTGSEPYYTTDNRDILIPGELAWNREESVVLTTDSFTGGVINFQGRVEVNSLTDFFINSMKKDGWKLHGSIKAENVLLAFAKKDSTCLIRIFSGNVATKTNVNIYVTKTLK